MHLLEVEKQPGLDNKLKVIFYVIPTGNVIQYKSFMNLEAAHIWPRSHKGLYLPSNGIALCRDMHWAFDKGMFTIGDDFKVIVHPDVESDYLQQ